MCWIELGSFGQPKLVLISLCLSGGLTLVIVTGEMGDWALKYLL